MILITGASGTVGKAVLREVAKAGTPSGAAEGTPRGAVCAAAPVRAPQAERVPAAAAATDHARAAATASAAAGDGGGVPAVRPALQDADGGEETGQAAPAGSAFQGPGPGPAARSAASSTIVRSIPACIPSLRAIGGDRPRRRSAPGAPCARVPKARRAGPAPASLRCTARRPAAARAVSPPRAFADWRDQRAYRGARRIGCAAGEATVART